jgi:hypothetical protein
MDRESQTIQPSEVDPRGVSSASHIRKSARIIEETARSSLEDWNCVKHQINHPDLADLDSNLRDIEFQAVLPIREVTMTRGPRALEGEVRG